ncbi:unnamed protein product [Absidia cylindrospora]
MKLADSPVLLPTPPSEKCDVVPTANLPTNCYAPITKDNDDDDAVKPAPSEPTPPDHQKVKTKQQQTMLIDTSASSDGPHFNEEVSLTSQPEDLPNHLLPTTNTNNQNGNAEVENISFTDNTVAASDPTDLPSTPSADAVKISQTQSLEYSDEIAVIKPSISEASDHTPTPSPVSSTHVTQTSTKIQDTETTAVHYLPPLSPSASLSSSLSTLNHIHSSDNHQENISGSGHQLQSLNTTSRLHHAYTEKQQQQQQQQQHTLDQVASLPRPHSSYSTHTLHSASPASNNVAPQPQGSSLSMKLNKLKKPGRRISQLFKKKNKNKVD